MPSAWCRALGAERLASEPHQLGAGRLDPELVRAEIDQHGALAFDTDDSAEAVLVVGYLVAHRVALGGRGGRFCNLEGATWQLAPGPGAKRSHYLQYAPSWRATVLRSPGNPDRPAPAPEMHPNQADTADLCGAARHDESGGRWAGSPAA